jgi:hypothetical protein
MHTTEQGVLLPKLWFSILIIPVQAPLLGHKLTAIPPTQCAFMMVSISVLTPSIALRSNGKRSEASPALESLLTALGLMTPTNLYPYTLMCVPQ